MKLKNGLTLSSYKDFKEYLNTHSCCPFINNCPKEVLDLPNISSKDICFSCARLYLRNLSSDK